MWKLSHYPEISVTGLFARRLTLCLLLVFSTYNESGRSYYHWLVANPITPKSLTVLVGIFLVCGWVAIVRAAALSLRLRGFVAVVIVVSSFVLFQIGLGLRSISDVVVDFTSVQLTVGLVLAIGLTWPSAQMRFSGERDVLHFPP